MAVALLLLSILLLFIQPHQSSGNEYVDIKQVRQWVKDLDIDTKKIKELSKTELHKLVKQQYRKLSLKYHPDHRQKRVDAGQDTSQYDALLLKVSEAYTGLTTWFEKGAPMTGYKDSGGREDSDETERDLCPSCDNNERARVNILMYFDHDLFRKAAETYKNKYETRYKENMDYKDDPRGFGPIPYYKFERGLYYEMAHSCWQMVPFSSRQDFIDKWQKLSELLETNNDRMINSVSIWSDAMIAGEHVGLRFVNTEALMAALKRKKKPNAKENRLVVSKKDPLVFDSANFGQMGVGIPKFKSTRSGFDMNVGIYLHGSFTMSIAEQFVKALIMPESVTVHTSDLVSGIDVYGCKGFAYFSSKEEKFEEASKESESVFLGSYRIGKNPLKRTHFGKKEVEESKGKAWGSHPFGMKLVGTFNKDSFWKPFKHFAVGVLESLLYAKEDYDDYYHYYDEQYDEEKQNALKMRLLKQELQSLRRSQRNRN